MNERTNREHLLREVLAEETDAGFRAALLQQSLRVAARRRRWQRARNAAAAVCMVLGVGALAWHIGLPRSPGAGRSYVVVTTEPLAPSAVITTHPLAPSQVLASFTSVELVQTPPRGQYRELDDRELLDLAAPSPAVLVRSGPNEAELVFVSTGNERSGEN